MINFYPDDVWLKRFGKPVISAGRRFLDFRNSAVIKYMNGVTDKLLGEYGVDYLKFDYNQDSGGYLDGDGDILEQIGQAFLDWVDGIIKKISERNYRSVRVGRDENGLQNAVAFFDNVNLGSDKV